MVGKLVGLGEIVGNPLFFSAVPEEGSSRL